jgi:hypothetical protein
MGAVQAHISQIDCPESVINRLSLRRRLDGQDLIGDANEFFLVSLGR